ncbi:MAG TPA: response regulator [Gemmataceae bacterium]|nr:response regulator [Gemmataceae bacterium]
MRQLRVLHLEDSDLDHELVLHQLDAAGLKCTLTRVQMREEFLAALQKEECFDIILADYSLPSFDGIAALKMAQELCPDTPFVFVTGAMGEEVAIETLKSGATDYVLKQHLERLASSVRRALREAADRAERRRLEEELHQRAEELAEAHRRKDEFLAILAHEMRNPLAPIRNALQLMRLRGIKDPVLDQGRDIIDRQVHHLSQLVDDLLDVSRITRGKIQVKRERVDLAHVIHASVETVRPLIDKRHHRLTTMLGTEPIWLDADPLRLEQIITNLLTNAAKYTDPGGQIALTVEREGDQAAIRVRDTGIGISATLQARIFDLYMQAEPLLERSQGGLGIGLTLVKQLVELQGGSIAVYSAGPGQGSEFTVRLPVYTQPHQQATPAAAEVTTAVRQPRSRRVVVVDDNKDGAESLAMLLEFWGHDVKIAHDGPSALKTVQAEAPEVVLLDIGLPGMDGYQVARRLRAGPQPNQAVLVALTGYGQDEDRRRTREAGFDYHLTKPINPDALQDLIAGASRL